MSDRELIQAAITEILGQDLRLVFVCLHGSFARNEPYHDIDIGVYAADPEANPFVLSADIKTRLSQRLKAAGFNLPADAFDVQILNQASFTFLQRIFSEGVLLVDRDPDLRTDLIERVSRKYRECAGILAEASIR
jgi:hypothetical protein